MNSNKKYLRGREKNWKRKEYYIKGGRKKEGNQKRIEGRIWDNIYVSKNFLSLVVLVKLHVLLATVRGEQQ